MWCTSTSLCWEKFSKSQLYSYLIYSIWWWADFWEKIPSRWTWHMWMSSCSGTCKMRRVSTMSAARCVSMYAYVYVCVCVYVYVYIYTCIDMSMRLCSGAVCVYVCICIYVCVCMCIYIYVSICQWGCALVPTKCAGYRPWVPCGMYSYMHMIYLCVYMCEYIYIYRPWAPCGMYLCMHMYMYICICIYICIYTSTMSAA